MMTKNMMTKKMMKSMMKTVLPILMMTVPMSDAYANGPPMSACESMIPEGHGGSTVRGKNPYILRTNATNYEAGDALQVTLEAPEGVIFKGFFIQARLNAPQREDHSQVGMFNTVTNGKFVTCNHINGTGWSHQDNKPKSSLSAEWIAPDVDRGTITFYATVVKGPDSSKYFTGLASAPIVFGEAGAAPPTEPTTAMSTASANIVYPSVLVIFIGPMLVLFGE